MSYILFAMTAATTEPNSRPGSRSVRYGPKVVMQNLSLDVVEGAITCIIASPVQANRRSAAAQRTAETRRRARAARPIATFRRCPSATDRDPREDRFLVQFAALFDSLSLSTTWRFHCRSGRRCPRQKSATCRRDPRERGARERDGSLSGGALRRHGQAAGFARAVVANPECVLYDERRRARSDHHARAEPT